MRCATDYEQDSIFGHTYHGVPSPLVPHLHPYPTRYHGPNFTVVQTSPLRYVENPYAVAPFAGGAALGQDRPPLLSSVTGYTILDGAVGAAFGYLIAPRKEERLMWTGIGGVVTALAGTLGLLGTAALIFASREKRS